MINISIGTNLSRKDEIVDGSMTPKEVWKQIMRKDVSTGFLSLDGSPLNTQEVNTPLSTLLNGADNCVLIEVVKSNNA